MGGRPVVPFPCLSAVPRRSPPTGLLGGTFSEFHVSVIKVLQEGTDFLCPSRPFSISGHQSPIFCFEDGYVSPRLS